MADLVKDWIEKGVIDNFGVVLIDANEDDSSSTPQYAHDDFEKTQYKPELTICHKIICESRD